jgi:2-dehydropantoate 2-reductase
VRVVVVGAGAVGSFLGGILSLGGEDVTLARHTVAEPEPAQLEIEEPAGRRRAAAVHWLAVERIDELQSPDLVILAVKHPALAGALRDVARWPLAPTLTVQNGIGAEALARELRPRAPLVAGSLTASVELVDRGRVRLLRRGGLGLAAVTAGALPVVRDLAAAFERGGLRVRVLPDARSMKWSKLLANLVANATSAILDLDPGEVYGDARLFDVERRQALEALAVMRAAGMRPVAIPGADARLLALGIRLPTAVARPVFRRIVAGARGGKSPSLRLHLRGRDDASTAEPLEASEARWLNGAVAAEGARLGIATPVNAALARLVDEAAADPARRAALRGNASALLAAIGS